MSAPPPVRAIVFEPNWVLRAGDKVAAGDLRLGDEVECWWLGGERCVAKIVEVGSALGAVGRSGGLGLLINVERGSYACSSFFNWGMLGSLGEEG